MPTRRQVLKEGAAVAGLIVGAAWLPQSALAAFNADAFHAKGIEETLKLLGAKSAAAESADVKLKAPDIAENGAVVPFTLSTTLPNVKQLALLIENNPFTLSALFDVTPEVEANFGVRSKMQETSNVYAVAITDDGKALYDRKEVKVTLGGCGG